VQELLKEVMCVLLMPLPSDRQWWLLGFHLSFQAKGQQTSWVRDSSFQLSVAVLALNSWAQVILLSHPLEKLGL
jgi:hypothetical protein